jgi:hypothetical protein
MSPAIDSFTHTIARATTTLRADECLIALRPWQLKHKGSTPDMLSPAKAAGLKAVPADPFDHKPMRLVMIEGQPIVYSVGKYGRDDAGLNDSDRDQRPSGDLIYRLKRAEPRR